MVTTYCVTGATGYIGSWLVKSLLLKGYMVHATARNPGLPAPPHSHGPLFQAYLAPPSAKITHQLLSFWSGHDRLKVFRADLNEDGSFDEAVKDCHGIFHVAASTEFHVSPKDNIDCYVQSNILDPAIKGTLNLLNACLKTESVKRIVFTSSISTISAKDDDGEWRSTVDESCQNPIDLVWNMKASGWVYVLSKLLTEETAFKFANQNKGIDLVSIIPTTVAGPFLTPSVPASVGVLLSPITGDPQLYPILSAVNARLGSISLVHIEDICNAHIFLMEEASAKGRYICSAHSCTISQLRNHLTQEYPYFNIQRSLLEEKIGSVPSEISSKKLRDLGFKYKYDLDEIIKQSVSSCVKHGFLSHP